MKKKRFSAEQIVAIRKWAEFGIPSAEPSLYRYKPCTDSVPKSPLYKSDPLPALTSACLSTAAIGSADKTVFRRDGTSFFKC